MTPSALVVAVNDLALDDSRILIADPDVEIDPRAIRGRRWLGVLAASVAAGLASGHASIVVELGGETVTVTEWVAIEGHAALTVFWVFIHFGRAGSEAVAVGGTVPVCR